MEDVYKRQVLDATPVFGKRHSFLLSIDYPYEIIRKDNLVTRPDPVSYTHLNTDNARSP